MGQHLQSLPMKSMNWCKGVKDIIVEEEGYVQVMQPMFGPDGK
jgi:hypothetical protein